MLNLFKQKFVIIRGKRVPKKKCPMEGRQAVPSHAGIGGEAGFTFTIVFHRRAIAKCTYCGYRDESPLPPLSAGDSPFRVTVYPTPHP